MSSLQLNVNTCQDKQDPQDGWHWVRCFHRQNYVPFFAHRVGMASGRGQYLLDKLEKLLEKLLPPLGTGTAD